MYNHGAGAAHSVKDVVQAAFDHTHVNFEQLVHMMVDADVAELSHAQRAPVKAA